ncbi:MAG: hypothetical protein HQ483_13000 [Rhodospirillales bacterium]|nr:hypothetical protein [Rhodospirillales bacterium]
MKIFIFSSDGEAIKIPQVGLNARKLAAVARCPALSDGESRLPEKVWALVLRT